LVCQEGMKLLEHGSASMELYIYAQILQRLRFNYDELTMYAGLTIYCSPVPYSWNLIPTDSYLAEHFVNI
jgi:hypothetical protein